MDVNVRLSALAAAFILMMGAYPVNAKSMQDMKDLMNDLLKDYNKHILPRKNQSDKLYVDVYTSLRAIADLDEQDERLTTIMVFGLHWKDDSIVWKHTEYNGIHAIHLDASLMWKPRIAVTNVHSSKHFHKDTEWDVLKYFYFGYTMWYKIQTFETTCSLDTTYYPFDVQRCSIQMFIVGYYDQIIFNPIDFDRHLYRYESHGTWNVSDYYISNRNGSNVTITYHLKRNPRYMIVNFLVPILILALLNPMVFLLPPDTGERIGYSMTILLALSVYMTILGEYLPQNSDPIPLMSYTIMIWYLLSAASLFVLFFNTHVYYRPETERIPVYVVVFVRVVRMLMCMQCGKKHDVNSDVKDWENQPCLDVAETHDKIENHGLKNNGDRRKAYRETKSTLLSGCGCMCKRKHSKENKGINPTSTRSYGCMSRRIKNREMTWQDVGRTIDKFFMVTIYIIKIMFAFIFMYMLSTRPELERIIAEKLRE